MATLGLQDYVHIVRRRWRIIVGCLLVAVAGAALVTVQLVPQYASTARLFVSTPQTDTAQAYQGGLFSAQRVTSYADLAGSRELAQRVIERLRLAHIDPADLTEKVDVSVTPETVILELTVTDANARRAQQLTQAYSEELAGFVADLETPPGKSRAPIKATVVDAGTLPMVPVSPKPLWNLGLAALLGLLLGLALAVMREMLDTTVKSHADISETAQVPLMGNIAYDSGAARRPLITALDSHAPRVEAFRVLRTNMQFIDVDRDSKVVVVTSSLPGEGKTTTATNLAITLSQAGQRVLLLEADLRRPKISESLKIEGTVGLTTVLVGRIDLSDAIQDVPIANLSVLTSGAIPPNPSELLQSRAMADLLGKLRSDFDVVIVDAPPLLPVTDAALLTAQSDGALLVVRHAKTTKDQLQHSLERLAAVDGRPLGVVFNMVPSRRGGGGYGSAYGYGYGYAPESGRRTKRQGRRAVS